MKENFTDNSAITPTVIVQEKFEVPLKKLKQGRANVDYKDSPVTAVLSFSDKGAFSSYVKEHAPPEGTYYDLSGKDLSGLNLDGAKLAYAVLDSSNLTSSSFAKADMTHSLLRGAHTEHASFVEADISNSYVSEAFLHRASASSNMKSNGLTFEP